MLLRIVMMYETSVRVAVMKGCAKGMVLKMVRDILVKGLENMPDRNRLADTFTRYGH